MQIAGTEVPRHRWSRLRRLPHRRQPARRGRGRGGRLRPRSARDAPRATRSRAARCGLEAGDVGDRARLAEVFEGVDGLFHAAVLPLNACTEDPRKCLEVNVVGTFNVFDAAREAGVKKIVFSSASSVYGDTNSTMDESHPLDARTWYGAQQDLRRDVPARARRRRPASST